jgi:CRP-like cAMP-binding protein
MALLQTLKAHAFTRGLTDGQLTTLSELAREVSFPENEVVLADGQRSSCFYLVVSGSVAVELRTRGFVSCVQSLGKGDVFGWSSLLDRQDTLFQVRTRELTSVIELDGARLKKCCFEDPALGAALLHRVLYVVAGRVKATEVRFAEMCGVRV